MTRPTTPEASADRPMHDEIAAKLPVPPERDLPAGVHQRHKDKLMQLIDNDRAATTTPRRHPRLRPALLVPAALAIAGALVITLATGSDAPSDGNTGGGSLIRAQDPRGAVVLLDRIAAAAAQSGTKEVRADQFVYVRSLQTGNVGKLNGEVKVTPAAPREVWMSQQPGPQLRYGLIHQDGAYFPIEEGVPDGETSEGTPEGIHRPTYNWLADLPTDPDTLLELLYAQTEPNDVTDANQAVFEAIGDLISETVLPPANAAALYKAAARLPGVTEVADAVDAKGRHGLGIARTDPFSSVRTTWIFDRSTLSYLGQRDTLAKTTFRGKAGALMGASAVLERAVVEAERMRP
ncbi:CU044_5270 family protein [Streptomyces sp. NPDC048301]|uniref:CU044_5270 family protein n=1 Tax=unclassified Streptomyces TaxID=2593676 RepID=UPI00341FCF27